MNQEKTNLKAHVEMCELRYQQLDQRIVRIENQIREISAEVRNFRETVDRLFAETKTLLIETKDQRFQAVVAASATIIVSLIGLLGYIVVNMR